MKRFIKVITFSVLLFTNISCWKQLRPDKITKDFYGNYIFQYPSYETEVLTINRDNTFKQQIFKDESSFRIGVSPILKNTGKWSEEPDNTLRFSNWLNYSFMFQVDSILDKPDKSLLPSVIWKKSRNGYREKIYIYYETGFVFEKDTVQ
ncbi:hypothetical protein [Ulvibacterium marinum]|uniref:Uncharacterized protein n=1 Tax=Ulvibacterium marinum TaxID=2419782 RepID=A0A3B0BUH0_9FLAO|nr:hypothetical protein [Ulvibacterium marinum]RKN75914.1 hypothetical protein D7Z94_24955 [Ulvibacterium marinum]